MHHADPDRSPAPIVSLLLLHREVEVLPISDSPAPDPGDWDDVARRDQLHTEISASARIRPAFARSGSSCFFCQRDLLKLGTASISPDRKDIFFTYKA